MSDVDWDRAKKDFPYFCKVVLGSKPRSLGISRYLSERWWEILRDTPLDVLKLRITFARPRSSSSWHEAFANWLRERETGKKRAVSTKRKRSPGAAPQL